MSAQVPALRTTGDGITFGSGGEIGVGPAFRVLQRAWITGVAAMARAGARIVVDDVFLGGADSQREWRVRLDGLRVLWVGVRCDAAGAADRELARGDRVTGLAATQADLVHRGVAYTSRSTPRTPRPWRARASSPRALSDGAVVSPRRSPAAAAPCAVVRASRRSRRRPATAGTP